MNIEAEIKALAEQGWGYRAIVKSMNAEEYRVSEPTVRRVLRDLRGAGDLPTALNGSRAIVGASELPEPVISGLKPDDYLADPELAYQIAVAGQQRVLERVRQRKTQRITFSPEPTCVAFISDIHFGAVGTDYEAARRDAELIRATPGMWAVFHGDGVDQMLIGKLMSSKMKTILTQSQEWALFRAWLGWLDKKLLVAVSGNHDSFFEKLVGFDYLRELLPPHVLYDPAECILDFEVGRASWRTVIRHKTRYNSVLNALHGLKQQFRLGPEAYDIAVAGHVHRGAVYEPFYAHGKRRLAILTGTYKKDDTWARTEGFLGGGEGSAVAVVLTPDGRAEPFDNLTTAAEFLTFLRSKT